MIGKIIKRMRKEKGLTQKEVSELTKIPQNTISQYENEKIKIDFETIYKISNLCDFKIKFEHKNITITPENITRKEL